MTKSDMMVRIAKAEGVMLTLYGICRDLVIGCSVDEDKDGKLGAVVADAMGMLAEVYEELGDGSAETDETVNVRLPGWMRMAPRKSEQTAAEEDEP